MERLGDWGYGGRVKNTDEKDRWSGCIFFNRDLSEETRGVGVWKDNCGSPEVPIFLTTTHPQRKRV